MLKINKSSQLHFHNCLTGGNFEMTCRKNITAKNFIIDLIMIGLSDDELFELIVAVVEKRFAHNKARLNTLVHVIK